MQSRRKGRRRLPHGRKKPARRKAGPETVISVVLLGFIELLIGQMNGFAGLEDHPERRDAKADGHLVFPHFLGQDRDKIGGELLADGADRGFVHIGEGHQKLVAAVAECGDLACFPLQQKPPEILQHAVARVVAPAVVDALEVVDVDHHIDHLPGRFRDVAAQAEAVAHARQLVPNGGFPQMLDLDLAQDDCVAALVLPLDDHAADQVGAELDDDDERDIDVVAAVADDGGVPPVEQRQQNARDDLEKRNQSRQLPVPVDRRERDGRDSAYIHDNERVVEKAECKAHDGERKGDEVVAQMPAEPRQAAEPIGREIEQRIDERRDDEIAQIITAGGRGDHAGSPQNEGEQQLDRDGDDAQNHHGLKVRAAPLILQVGGFLIIDPIQLAYMFQFGHRNSFPAARAAKSLAEWNGHQTNAGRQCSGLLVRSQKNINFVLL